MRDNRRKIANRDASGYVVQLIEFKGNNLSSVKKYNYYIVYSYEWYPIYVYDYRIGQWYENASRYSRTTAKHITQSRPTDNTIKMNDIQLRNLHAII